MNAKVLRDWHADKEQKKQALGLLAHFVGDIHQPLHAGYPEDLGGNSIKVRFFGRVYLDAREQKKVNLRSVWDSLLIDRRMENLDDLSWEDYAERLNEEITDTNWRSWTDPATNSVARWADTSYQRARVNAYRDTNTAGRPSPDNRVRSNDDLQGAYYDQAVPIVERSLKEGGVRLAAILNAIYSGAGPIPFGDSTAIDLTTDHAVAPTAGGGTIRIATFNIQNLGKTKAGKPEVMATLVDIVRRYDVAAVQELSDISNTVPQIFLDKINDGGLHYNMLVSPRTGRQDDDKTSQEQYAFYFNTASIQPLDAGRLSDDGDDDLFQREPFLARFRAKAGNFTFVLITTHTAPQLAVEEIGALDDVMSWARTIYPDEGDFIALGDFNGSCNYASPADLNPLPIRGSNYRWLIPDDADTNLAAAQCAYDRIVTTTGANEDFAGTWSVDKAFTDKKISDHWPAWAEFFVNHDTE